MSYVDVTMIHDIFTPSGKYLTIRREKKTKIMETIFQANSFSIIQTIDTSWRISEKIPVKNN